jgi:arylsulfatase A-like enzyme
VVFLVDDLGWRDVGYAGSAFYLTPHIDALAESGVRFERAYANAPNCAPSRACLMTGRWTPRHGVYTVGSPARGKARDRRLIPAPNSTELPLEERTLAEVFAEESYVTGCFGKWHLGPDPTQHGFQVNVGGNRSGSPKGGYFAPWKNPQLPPAEEGTYLTDHLTDLAVDFVREQGERPFLLYLSHYGVHTPIQAREEDVVAFLEREPDGEQANAKYAGMIAAVDRSLGRVVAALSECGLERDTLVVFTSDHGGHGISTSNLPLRGSKGMLYEGGIRVPLVLSWPGQLPAGERRWAPVTQLDLLPTLCAAGGLRAPGELDGDDLWPWLTAGAELAPRSLYWHFPAYLEAYRSGGSPWRTVPVSVIQRDGLKLIENFETGDLEVYDVAADETEARRLEDPGVAAELYRELQSWQRRVGAPVQFEREGVGGVGGGCDTNQPPAASETANHEPQTTNHKGRKQSAAARERSPAAGTSLEDGAAHRRGPASSAHAATAWAGPGRSAWGHFLCEGRAPGDSARVDKAARAARLGSERSARAEEQTVPAKDIAETAAGAAGRGWGMPSAATGGFFVLPARATWVRLEAPNDLQHLFPSRDERAKSFPMG